jgi:hypothetical protein
VCVLKVDFSFLKVVDRHSESLLPEDDPEVEVVSWCGPFEMKILSVCLVPLP